MDAKKIWESLAELEERRDRVSAQLDEETAAFDEFGRSVLRIGSLGATITNIPVGRADGEQKLKKFAERYSALRQCLDEGFPKYMDEWAKVKAVVDGFLRDFGM